MMLFACCGLRRGKRTDSDDESHTHSEPEAEWLLGDPQIPNYTDPQSKPERHADADLLREIVRETENKMVNVTDPQPFLFHNPLPPLSSSDSNDTSFYGGSSSSSVSRPSSRSQHRHVQSVDRYHRSRVSASPPAQAHSPHGRTGRRHSRHDTPERDGSRAHGHGRRTPSPSTKHDALSRHQPYHHHHLFQSPPSHQDSAQARQHNHKSNKGSRSSSRDRSYRSTSSSSHSISGEPRYQTFEQQEWNGVDNGYYHGRYSDEADDFYDEDLKAPTHRRAPKLRVQILPYPGSEGELMEVGAAERRDQYGGYEGDHYPFDDTDAGGDDGEATPVQGGMRPSITPRPSTIHATIRGEAGANIATDPSSVEVKPLGQEDYDAIIALSDALWKALENGLLVSERDKVVRDWND